MRLSPDLRWRSLLWWLAVTGFALALKRHYSLAGVEDLDWMLRPLTLLLEWFTGQGFHRDGNFEWVSLDANLRLVKACAGINFMLMSFLVYAWIFRPDRKEESTFTTWCAGRLMLLCAAVVAAWATALLANSLRILIAMRAESQGWGLGFMQLDADELHRLIGLLVYVPLLSLQMLPGRRSSFGQVLAAPILLYPLLMGLVPLMTGNALQHSGAFLEQLRQLFLILTLPGTLYLILRIRLRLSNRKHHAQSDSRAETMNDNGNDDRLYDGQACHL